MVARGCAVVGTGVDDPFAERTCAALKGGGDGKIRVTGCLGGVSTSGGKITVLRNGQQGGKDYDGNVPGSCKVCK